MNAERIKKGAFTVLLSLAFFVTAVCGIVAYAALGARGYARVVFSQKYYFLVQDCEEAASAAVAGGIYASGGAGYYLKEGGAVAIACYYRQANAESVQQKLLEKGTATRILVREPAGFVLRGKRSAEKKSICDNVDTVDSLARLLYEAANGLERSQLTQEEARSAVRGVQSSLAGLIQANGENCARWNEALYEARRKSAEAASGILFARDVRYLQAMLCDCVVNAATFFS